MKKIPNYKLMIYSLLVVVTLLYTATHILSKKNKNIIDTITLESSEYDSTIRPLPPISTLEKTLENDGDVDDSMKEYFVKGIEEYGELALRFLETEGGIMRMGNINVDKDTKPETWISFCYPTANRCPHKIIIIKEGNIIFSTTAGYSDLSIDDLKGEEGFYVIWKSEENEKSEDRHNILTKTKFLKVDGIFKPVHEEHIKEYGHSN